MTSVPCFKMLSFTSANSQIFILIKTWYVEVVVYVDSLGITSLKFWGKLQEKTVVGTRRCTWENNFKMGFKEIG